MIIRWRLVESIFAIIQQSSTNISLFLSLIYYVYKYHYNLPWFCDWPNRGVAGRAFSMLNRAGFSIERLRWRNEDRSPRMDLEAAVWVANTPAKVLMHSYYLSALNAKSVL